MTAAANVPRRFQRSPPRESARHFFALGDAVQLKDTLSGAGKTYLITAKLPPSGDSLQYRIRNDDERFERVTTQANLEFASASHSDSDVLTRKSFNLGETR
jgi:hypothetical protein